MLQNRVDPFGNIIKTSARGSVMGNRGVIHNEHKVVTHAFKHKAWIACVLLFKGRHRSVMASGKWTELFFLDEATALAAGHRPCFECRRDDANLFKECWITGNPDYRFTRKTSITKIDEILHRERIDNRKQKITHQRNISDVSDGTFVLVDDRPYLVSRHQLLRWTPFGYDQTIDIPSSTLTVLTPNSIVNALNAGYVPMGVDKT
jgi:hypothetical protein